MPTKAKTQREYSHKTTRHLVFREPGKQWGIIAVTRSSVVLRRKFAKEMGIEVLGDYATTSEAVAAIDTRERVCCDCQKGHGVYRCHRCTQKRFGSRIETALSGSAAVLEAIDAAKAIVRQAGGRA